MLEYKVPLLEIVLRVTLIYVFLLAAMRLFGKREIGRWTPMEFLGMLLLARAVGPAMNAGDNSLPVAGVAAVTLLALTYVCDYLVFRSKKMQVLIEGRPEVLIRNGRLLRRTMRSELLTRQEVDSALRRENISSLEEVELAVIEPDGRITVVPKKKDP